MEYSENCEDNILNDYNYGYILVIPHITICISNRIIVYRFI